MLSMRSALAGATFAAALAMATAAGAATATGTVAQVDLATNMITLASGDVFKLGTGLGASHYQVGEQVEVAWSGYEKGYMAAYDVQVTAPAVAAQPARDPFFSQASPVAGTIVDVDLGANMLTLSNGDIFKLGTGLGASHYQVGEQVRVRWEMGNKGYKEAYRIDVGA
ncbi:MAG: hypothetical protein AB7F67_21290 [Rhodospirillaceae bacterium]